MTFPSSARITTTAALTVLVALAAPQLLNAAGVPHLESASSGNVKAVLAYVKTVTVTGHFTYQGKAVAETQTTYDHLRASVFIGGRLIVSQLLANKLVPAGAGMGGKSIRVKTLDATAPPSVLVDLYTGGAHCCYTTLIYLLNSNGLAGRIQANWGDPGYRLVDLDGDGTLEFVSANDAFAYAFTDYADSALPIQIWNIQNGRLVDTTASHLGTVAADAKTLLKYYTRQKNAGRDVRGILAAYVADETLLGTPDAGWNLVNSALADGELDRGYGPPKGSQYISALRRFLPAHGYVP